MTFVMRWKRRMPTDALAPLDIPVEIAIVVEVAP